METLHFQSLSPEEVTRIWAPHDEALRDLFSKIGWSKGHGVSPRAAPWDVWSFSKRAQKFPFSELDDDAQVSLGTHAAIAELDLDAALPSSMTAYREGLVALESRLGTYRPSTEEFSQARDAAVDIEAECRNALRAQRRSRGALRTCAFAEGKCDTDAVVENAKTIRESLVRWRDAHSRLSVTLATLADPNNLDCDPW